MVVVVAASSPVTAAVRDVLRDWAALGLVQPLLWLDADEISPTAPVGSVIGTRIVGGGAERVRLQDQLANAENLGVVRLIALGTLGARPSMVGSAVAGFLVTALSGVTGGRLSPVQLVLSRQGAGGWHSGFEQPGWRTLVVAPEDAFSPGRPATELLEDTDDTEPIAHSAAALAAVAGLWTGMGESAFDAQGMVAVPEPQVVRAFLRRLDAGAVTSGLRKAITDVSRGLPRPQTAQGACAHLQSPGAGADQIAQAVLLRHASLFAIQQASLPAEARIKQGPLQAIAAFFRFLVAAFKRAPRELAQSLMNRGAARISAAVQNALYGGTDSRYEVVTRGVNARGLPAGVGDLASVARDVNQRVGGVLQGEQSLPDLTTFWRDVIAGGLTLADAGYERLPDVAPLVVDGLPGVVRETAWVAPAPEDAFAMPGAAGTRHRAATVTPYDVRAHDQAAQDLSSLSADDAEAARLAEDFGSWRERVTSSYTGVIGRRLANEVNQRTLRLRELLEVLRSSRETEDDTALATEQNRVRKIVKIFAIGVLVIVLVAVVVGLLGLIGLVTLILIAVAVTLGWCVHFVLAIIKQQQRIFAILNARLDADRQLEIASRNLGYVAQALHLATTLYEQYLAWAPVLGRFLREPFGAPPEPPVSVRLDGVLPRAVGFGVARYNEDSVANTAAELMPSIFERGWLSALWKALVDDAPRLLGPRGVALRTEPQGLLADLARDDESLLREWSAIVATQGVPTGAGDALWSRARTVLLQRGVHSLATSLFTEVDVQAQAAHEVRGPRSGATFFTELTDSLQNVDAHYFLPGLFAPVASSNGAHKVRNTIAIGDQEVADLTSGGTQVRWIAPTEDSKTSLDQFLVVLQTSSPLPSSQLKLDGGQVRVREPAPAPRLPDDDSTLI